MEHGASTTRTGYIPIAYQTPRKSRTRNTCHDAMKPFCELLQNKNFDKNCWRLACAGNTSKCVFFRALWKRFLLTTEYDVIIVPATFHFSNSILWPLAKFYIELERFSRSRVDWIGALPLTKYAPARKHNFIARRATPGETRWGWNLWGMLVSR